MGRRQAAPVQAKLTLEGRRESTRVVICIIGPEGDAAGTDQDNHPEKNARRIAHLAARTAAAILGRGALRLLRVGRGLGLRHIASTSLKSSEQNVKQMIEI